MRFMAKVHVINGPNLNLLGTREPHIYGHETLDAIEVRLNTLANANGHSLQHFQSNGEGALVEAIQRAGGHGGADRADMIIINPAAYGHTSVALRDALLAVALPFIEVHLTNVSAREGFRQKNLLSDIALGVIQGFGAYSYELALSAVTFYLKTGGVYGYAKNS